MQTANEKLRYRINILKVATAQELSASASDTGVDNSKHIDDDNTLELGGLFSFGNPFDFSRPSIRIPWWLRRKMKTKVYDANGMECADPKKDLQ